MKHLLLLLLLVTTSSFAKNYSITPTPDWINNDIVESVNYQGDNSQAISYLLNEIQYNLRGERQRFHRQIISINTLQGLSQFTHYNIDFDPSYEQVALHKISVINKSGTVSQLDNKYIKTLSLENRLNENIYTGNKRINILLEALNVGDVVEIEFTVKGANPVFEGYFFTELALQAPVYTNQLHYRLVYDEQHPVQSKIHGHSLADVEVIAHGEYDKSWLLKDIPPIVAEENVPPGYIAYPWLQLSQFASWVEVRNWANGLFYNANTTDVYQRLDNQSAITEWYNKVNNTQLADSQLGINELLFAVRNNLRYTMDAEGVHSHLAHSPLETINKGYGDCKDKVNVILAHQYNSFKPTTFPVLVNSKMGKTINQWLPTPSAFDHAIILYRTYDDKEYWLDPTINTSIKNFNNQLAPDYGYALILQSGVDDIYPMYYQPTPARDFLVTETIDLSEKNQGVLLDVKVELNAYTANNVRELLNTDPQTLSKQLLANYRSMYPDIEIAEDFKAELDKYSHKVTITGKLKGKPSVFWQKANGLRKVSIAPIHLSAYLPNVINKDRTHPFYVPGIVNYRQKTKIIKPFELKDSFTPVSIQNDNFSFTQVVKNNRNTLDMDIGYQMKTDSIKPRDFDAYNKDITQLRNAIGITLTVTFPDIDNVSDSEFSVKTYTKMRGTVGHLSINWTLVMMVLFALMPMVYLLKKASSYKVPSDFEPDIYQQGFFGTLLVVAIAFGAGLIITLGMSIRLIPFFTENVWSQYTNSSSGIYHELWGAYLPFIVIMEVFILIATFAFTYQFFNKRYSAKMVFALLQGSKLLLLVVTFFVTKELLVSFKDLDSIPSLLTMQQSTIVMSGLLQLGLLVYLMSSSQVKNTLIR